MTRHDELRAHLQAAATSGELTPAEVASVVDHTALKAEVTAAEIETLCAEALRLGCASVCVNLGFAHLAGSLLQADGPALCCVVDFPLGAAGTATRVAHGAAAVQAGATEVDVVANIGSLIARDFTAVEQDLGAVRAAIGPDVTLKVILETALLDAEAVRAGSQVARAAGADFVKTSTGFHAAGGATAEAVAVMAAAVPSLGVKASGGIRTWEQAQAMLAAGATRLGLSGTSAVLAGAPGG